MEKNPLGYVRLIFPEEGNISVNPSKVLGKGKESVLSGDVSGNDLSPGGIGNPVNQEVVGGGSS